MTAIVMKDEGALAIPRVYQFLAVLLCTLVRVYAMLRYCCNRDEAYLLLLLKDSVAHPSLDDYLRSMQV